MYPRVRQRDAGQKAKEFDDSSWWAHHCRTRPRSATTVSAGLLRRPRGISTRRPVRTGAIGGAAVSTRPEHAEKFR